MDIDAPEMNVEYMLYDIKEKSQQYKNNQLTLAMS